uniref:FecR family protein n=1 Tax=Pedobacter schmidteae TaxID=2201271 RepID=UPI000EABE9CC|nr:FecR family protein [Pedobacter schmidteae]
MTDDPEKLLDKYNAGLCTDEEKSVVESWYLKMSAATDSKLNPETAVSTKEKVWAALSANKTPAHPRYLKYKIASAAVLIVGLTLTILYHTEPANQHKLTTLVKQDIAPGGNKAFLTLSNGKRLSLTDAANGHILKNSGLQITKTAEGQLVYTVSRDGAGSIEKPGFNEIETPRGGQYQVNLPDGTKVWLNAASSLRYPTRFTGKDRIVELKGEGYFEVAKDVKRPFIVKSDRQQVEVLGTHFNINSYPEEESTHTTLLEGSVKVHTDIQGKTVLLKPGQQSKIEGDKVDVENADIESVLAWKNGDFFFKGDDIKTVMNKVSRWYDVTVVYKGNFSGLKFGGLISRSKNISSVLNIMESTGKVHFKIEAKTITVSR